MIATCRADAPVPRSSSWAPGFDGRKLVWMLAIAWVTVILSVRRIAESDLWYHLSNARQLLESGSFPTIDRYTFTAAGAPLVDHEWLSELVYYAAYQGWAHRGLLAVYGALLVASYGAVFALAHRRGAGRAEAGIVTIFAVALGSYSFGPRMMHFGWLCLVVLMYLLERCERRPESFWLLPLLFMIWINLHGSWIFGFAVLAATLADGWRSAEWGNIVATRWSKTHRWHALGATVASAVALLFNPYGWKLVWYPFDLRVRQAPALRAIVEWQSVDFHSGYGKLALVMLLGVLVTAWLSREKWRLRDALLVLFAVWASMTYVRFLGFAALVLVPIIAPRVPLLHARRVEQDRRLLNYALAAALAFAIIKSVPSEKEIDDHIGRQFPRAALDFMRVNRIEGRLFHLYDFGGFIEWYAPHLKTFADGRTDIFVYSGIMQDYLKAIEINQSLEILDKYRIDYVLYTTGGRLSYLLEHSAGWRTVYRDEVAHLFARVEKGDAAGDDASLTEARHSGRSGDMASTRRLISR